MPLSDPQLSLGAPLPVPDALATDEATADKIVSRSLTLSSTMLR